MSTAKTCLKSRAGNGSADKRETSCLKQCPWIGETAGPWAFFCSGTELRQFQELTAWMGIEKSPEGVRASGEMNRSSDKGFGLPGMTVQTQKKADDAENPVNLHGEPDADQAHVHGNGE